MNGTICIWHKPADSFKPVARRNSADPRMAYVTLSHQAEFLLRNADEAHQAHQSGGVR